MLPAVAQPGNERAYVPALESAGYVLRIRERYATVISELAFDDHVGAVLVVEPIQHARGDEPAPRLLRVVDRLELERLRDDAEVTSTDATRLAVLIDSDNTTATLTTELLEEIAKYGTPTVKRAYGDWTTQHLVGWKEELLRHAIQPVQQFAYTRGKNSTDSALIIDAMDLLYAGNLEGFVIVSSDSDFTRLATRLREAGMTVYGLGRRSTPAPFVAACDRFIYLDLLRDEPPEPAQRASEDEEPPPPPPPNLKRILSTAISSTSKDDGWSNLGEVGSYLIKSHAAFDPRDYGHSKLGELVRAEPYVEMKDVPTPTGPSQLWVRLKPRAAKSARTR